MHELSITQNIVATVAEHAKGRPVKRVTLEVGRLAGVMTDAVLFCFDIVAEGTALNGAVLEIRDIEARARCNVCDQEFTQTTLFAPCQCGSRDLQRLSGEELNIKEFEFDLEREVAPPLAGGGETTSGRMGHV